MLESVFNSNVIYYVMGVIVAVGVISKMVVSITLRRLVRASKDMAKSTHKFMKLVRAKFEHACMVNTHVENIPVFVDKYIYEYRVFKMNLYSWRKLEKTLMILLGFITLLACGASYYYASASEIMLQKGMVGIALMILLYAVYQLGDEKFAIESMRVHMVDYLENVCAARYAKNAVIKNQDSREKGTQESREKINQESRDKIQSVKPEGRVAVNASSTKQPKKVLRRIRDRVPQPEIEKKYDGEEAVIVQAAETAIEEKSENRPTLSMVEKMLLDEAERRMEMKKQKQDDYMPNEATIREILQEFMA